MIRLLLLAALVGGLTFLYQQRRAVPKVDFPAYPPGIDDTLSPRVSVLAPEELEKIRAATKDGNPAVRWGAMELLYRLGDPQAMGILENMLALDTEPMVRKNALEMLRHSSQPRAMQDLVKALKDPEKDIRLAALLALGERGDEKLVPHVTSLLADSDPDVRLQAIHTLGRLQERKQDRYRQLSNQLRQEYEEALRRARRDPASQDRSQPLSGVR